MKLSNDTTNLEFEYADPGGLYDPVYRAEYGNYTVDVLQEQSAEHPWDEWDGNPPMIVLWPGSGWASSGHMATYGDLSTAPPLLTRAEIKANGKYIAEAFGTTLLGLADRYNCDNAAEAINEGIYEAFSDLGGGDQLSMLETLWQAKGVACNHSAINGYSQGHWCEILIVLTDGWREFTGAKADEASDRANIDGAISLFRSWFCGDVFYYTVVRSSDEEVVGSCSRFYGTDFDQNGLAEHAADEIQVDVAQSVPDFMV